MYVFVGKKAASIALLTTIVLGAKDGYSHVSVGVICQYICQCQCLGYMSLVTSAAIYKALVCIFPSSGLYIVL